MNLLLAFGKKYNLHVLAARMGGIGGSFVASHLVALTATPAYSNWWAKLYLTAPTITNVPAFEKMVALYFSAGYLLLEHAYWNLTKNKAVNPPQEVKPNA